MKIRTNRFNSPLWQSAVVVSLLLAVAMPAFPLGLEKVDVITPSGTDSGLLSPEALFYDGLRNLLIVANTGAHQVVIMDRRGIATKVSGKGGELRFPTAVAVTNKGTLFIAERGKESLRVLPQYESGALEEYHMIELSSYRLAAAVQPSGLFVTKEGNLYIADRGNRQVLVFGSDEKFKFKITGVGEPADIWVGPGKIFVSDPGFGGIRVYNEEGKAMSTLGTSPAKFRAPLRIRTLAVDRRGRVWAVEEGNGIRVIDPSDNPLLSISREITGLFSSIDMTIDDNNNLYILEQGGNRISVFRITE
ncbi:MAG: hypothetical protein C4526_08885 [Nitrospiraceae bacterium]|nr:MAG: hypothetical protein C4526_08885 [Nitrospiraceae bacterium]